MTSEGLPDNNDKFDSTDSNGVNIPVEGKGENVALGEMIWIKVRGSLWWPAQVVDGKNLSKKYIPRKRSADEVLVRVYGSYTYRYVDPVTCNSEFEKILEKYGGDCNAILENTLEKDLARLRPGSSTGNKSESKGEVQSDDEEDKTAATSSNGKSPARRVRVMQNLGLVAPDGSPYKKNSRV